jgi:enterochelin esterase family protein
MAMALRFKGYDYRFEYGQGAHDRRHGAAIFPETMRWIFR